jgi:hypothetical protein
MSKTIAAASQRADRFELKWMGILLNGPKSKLKEGSGFDQRFTCRP